MRAVWTGTISFGLIAIPVKLYSAEESAKSVSFKTLHKEDHGPIGYQKVCKKCGKEVPTAEQVKGYEVDDDQYVIVEPDELKDLQVKSEHSVEIEAFVDIDEVDLALFDAPYLVGPKDAATKKQYALFRQALDDDGRLAIGRFTMRGRERVLALRPSGPGLIGYTLRDPAAVRAVSGVPLMDEVEDVEVNSDHLKLAKQLTDALTMPFAEVDATDRYQEALRNLVAAKVEGNELVTVEAPAATADGGAPDIMAALQASIDKAKADQKPARRASTRKKTTKKRKTG